MIDTKEEYEERAGIMEYDAEMTREKAEETAAEWIKNKYKKLLNLDNSVV